ncbi:MAG: thiamine pyrophosphate-dependent enzyme [Nitrososphaerota archaeon]
MGEMVPAGLAIRSVDTDPIQFAEHARRAEELGFGSIWVTEELARSGFTVLATASLKTHKIKSLLTRNLFINKGRSSSSIPARLTLKLADQAILTSSKLDMSALRRPAFIECRTYRFVGHGAYDLGTSYRPREEIEEWLRRDPINKDAKGLIKSGGATA